MREDERTVDGVLLLFFEVEDEWVKKLDSLAIGDLPMVLFALEEDVDRLFLLFFESEMWSKKEPKATAICFLESSNIKTIKKNIFERKKMEKKIYFIIVQ